MAQGVGEGLAELGSWLLQVLSTDFQGETRLLDL